MPRAWWKRYHELAAAHQPPRPEATFKGTVLCLLRHHFKYRRYWLIVAEALLREIAAEQTPHAGLLANIDDSSSEDEIFSDDSEDENETQWATTNLTTQQTSMEGHSNADVTMEEADELTAEADNIADVSLDSQGNKTREGRRKARRADFSVSKSQAVLFRNQTHLWVEVKNGSQPPQRYTNQLREYITRIAATIPPGFLEVHPDVVFMLIDANRTYYWRITPDIVARHGGDPIWGWASRDITFGPSMTAVLHELSQRPDIDVA